MITKNVKHSGYLFLGAGVAFTLAALLNDQRAFYGIAVMFVLIGIGFIIKAQKEQSNLP